jgi:hypothetical protein
LGRPNPSFEKRLREQKKREKRAEKARKKAERAAAKKLGPTDEADADEPPTEPDESAGGSD